MKIIQQFNEEWPLSPEDEGLWHQWANSMGHEFNNVLSLLTESYREGFKARGVFLMLTPDYKHIPFCWGERNVNCRRGWKPWRAHELPDHCIVEPEARPWKDLLALQNLSPELLDLVFDLVGEFQVIADSLAWSEGGYIYQESLKYYNKWNLQLLTVSPEEKAEQAFKRFSVANISYTYSAFEDILDRKDVDQRWKRRADARMRELVLAELSSDTNRHEHESAVGCYDRAVFSHTDDPQLFASQITFLLDSGADFDLSEVPGIFNTLPGEEYEDLRHRVARHFILKGNGEVFHPSYYGEWAGDLTHVIRAGKAILAELGEGEPELSQQLRPLVQALKVQRDISSREYEEEEKKKKIAEQALLEQMMR